MIDERERLTDSLITQKYIAHGYNAAASEAANSHLMETFMSLLRDEHQIQHEMFHEMHSRGWYQVKMASANDVNQNLTRWNQDYQRLQSTVFRQPGIHQPYQPGISPGIPQYGFGAGAGVHQMTGEIAHQVQQSPYRPPQNPVS